MTELPPTQILKPAFFDEGDRVAVLIFLDQIEKRGVDLKQRSVAEIREKVRRKIRTLRRYGLDDKPFTREMLDSIIQERQQGGA